MKALFTLSFLAIFLIFLSGCASKIPETDKAGKRLHQLFESSWEKRLKNSPEFASYFGDERYNDKLSNRSIEEIERRHQETKSHLKELLNISREQLSPSDKVNYDIFKLQLEKSIEEYSFSPHFMPITGISGFHISFANIGKYVPLRNKKHFEDLLARYKAFPKAMEQTIALMKMGLEKGMTPPQVTFKGWEGSVLSHPKTKVTESAFYKPFKKIPNSVSELDKSKLRMQAKKYIKDYVYPAYTQFGQFMKDTYVPGARKTIGASELPNGKAYYEMKARNFTTLNLTPKEIHQTGLSEVKRIKAEMMEIIKKVKFKGGFQKFVEHLRTHPKFYAKTKQELLDRISFILKKADGNLPKLFKTLPRLPYGLNEIPEHAAAKAPTAYYYPGSGDGTRAGFYSMNTSKLDSRPLYEMEALSLHEAVPGHHLQIALQQELKDLPKFRRFDGFTAFSEGWGLYAESLGDELEFYEDPYSRFGKLSYEMWRACRLVVDTGMHYFSWSRDRAIKFFEDNTSLTKHNIRAEIDRYIGWPGQALAYKTGELKIKELRARARKELGTKFDIRDFHDVVLLQGPVPLLVLEKNVENYISTTR